MKKFFTLLMAMMIVGLSFAQNFEKPQMNFNLPQAKKGILPTQAPKLQQDQSKTTSFWFEYNDALERYGYVPELDIYPLSGDTSIYYAWSNSAPSHSFFIGTGRYFDWAHHSWNDFYFNHSTEPVPALWTSSSYTIDSIDITYYHKYGDSVNQSIKDTLVINYVLNLEDEGMSNWYSVDTLTQDTLWFGSDIAFPINMNNFTLCKDNQLTGDHHLALGENVQIIEQKALIQADTSNEYNTLRIATPDALHNISDRVLAVYYTYKPGKQAEGSTIMGEDANYFFYAYCTDIRDEYVNGGDAPRYDLNADFKIITNSIVLASNWTQRFYGQTVPSLITGVEHSVIALHAVCDDCGIVNVEEMEKENATIYPNPATSEINVVTNNNEKTLVEMFNLVGQKVYSEQFVNSTKINVSNMKAGVYMLKVNNHTTKVVVR